MKKFLSVLLAIAVLSSTLVALTACTKADKVLYVYNWDDYIGEGILDEFAEWYEGETGNTIEVKYSTFETNETMLTRVEKGNSNIDVICPSEYAVQRLATNDLLLDLTNESIWADVEGGKADLWENVNTNIKDKVSGAFGDLKLVNYFAPYMMGTLGVLYNSKYVRKADIDCGFGLLWNEAKNPNLDGMIYFKDSIRDAYAATVLYLKQFNKLPSGNASSGKAYAELTVEELINCTDDALVNAAETALKVQKEINKGYSVDLDKEYLIDGSAYATLAWSGDALYAIEASDEELEYFVPEIGSNIWFDGWCIPKSASNVKEALMFMQFMSRPDNCVKNMLEIGYVSAVTEKAIKENAAAKKLLEDAVAEGLFISHIVGTGTIEDFFDDPIRYQTQSEYDSLGLMYDFGKTVDEKMITMWENVKAESDFPWLIVGIICGVVLVAIVVFFVFRMLQSSKNKKRKNV